MVSSRGSRRCWSTRLPLAAWQALYSENGGLHTVFTKPTFFNVISSLSLLSLSILVCIGFKTEW